MMRVRTTLCLMAAWIIFSGMGACAGNSAEQNSVPAEEGGVLGPILENPSRFASITVTVTGVFHGWRGPCLGVPPVSRSDWMIADASGCIYVSGPIPSGLDAAKPAGEKISVTGVVRLKKGRPYIDASAVPEK